MQRAPVPKMISHGHRPMQQDPAVKKAQELSRLPKNTIAVEHAVVINLPRSVDRLKMFQATNKFDKPTILIEAVDGLTLPEPKHNHMRRGDVACLLSHKKALETAKNNGWPCVMVFEDDISMATDFNERLKAAMSELPNNWDMVWLAGAQRYPSVPFSTNLLLMQGAWGGYGYILRDTMYDFFIGCFATEQHSCDTYYSEYHSRFNSFRITPDLVRHIGNVSDRLIVNHT